MEKKQISTAGITKKSWDWLFNLSSKEKPLTTQSPIQRIKNGYRGVIYSCTTIIANDVSSTEWWLENRDGEKVKNPDVYELLKNPNSLMTWNDLVEISTIFLELTGNAYWYIARNKVGKPLEIWPIPSYNITPKPKEDEFGIDFYKVTGIKGVKQFDVDEIVHFKYQNPNNIYVGIGTLDAAIIEADINNFSKQYVMNFYKNGAIPAGILTTDEKLNEADARRIEQKWNEKYQGTNEAWGVAVLWGGFKYESLSLNPATEKFIEQSRWTRQDIASIFKVPLSKLGIVEDVNRANAEANNATYMENCIAPKLAMIERKINNILLPLIGLAEYTFKFENVVPEDKELALKQQQLNIQKAQIGGMLGILSGDEIRELLGFDGNGLGEIVQLGKDVEEIEHLIKALQEFSIK